MIRQFGLYPRFFVKRRKLLDPIINKYSAESVTGKSKGQAMKIYFQLIKNNPEFRAEVDALIEQQGSKLLTIQEKIAGKKVRTEKVKNKEIQKGTAEVQSNFLNASEATTTDLTDATEADFIAAIEYEEGQENMSTVLKVGGAILLIAAGCYVYKHYIKGKFLSIFFH